MCKKLIYLVSFVLVLSLVLTSVAEATDPNLVGCWPFDMSADDFSGNGNHGTIHGNPEWVPGKFFEALHFDGVDDYVKLTNQPPITNGFTFSAWVKRNGDIPSTQEIFNNNQFFLRTTPESEISNNPFEAFVKLYDGSMDPSAASTIGQYLTARSNVASTIGQWFFVTVTWDKTTLKIYVNGELKGSSTKSEEGELISTTVEARIGRSEQTDVDANPFNGLIDEVRIYNRVLTQEEIQQTMTTHASHQGALYPEPAIKAIDVPRDVTLSWTPGEFAAPVNGHKVYFGESFDDVNDATGGVAQSINSYDLPQRLDFGTTYYWRVDEVNAPPTSHIELKGNVWSFTTEPIAYPIEDVNATASSALLNMDPENIINGSGLDADDLHSTEQTDMWVSGSEPNGAWIEYEFDKVYKLHEMLVWNSNQTTEPVVGFGIKEATIEYSVDGTNWAILGVTHEFAQAPGVAGYACNTVVDFNNVVAKYVKIIANGNWGGIVPQYSLSEVRFLHIPLRAREPQPELGATDVDVNLILNWRAGREATEHDVYISTDEHAVIDGNVPVNTVNEAQDGPLPLDLSETYYWKVNEVNIADVPMMLEADIWNFSTQEYLVVDGFELYNDLNPDEPGSNRIFNTWIDGYDNPAVNGSIVGYDDAPFAEQSIVSGGKQSMPFFYDNSTAAYSEATVNIADLPISQDWSKSGIKALALWFYGDPSNTAQPMYVKLNGSKVTYDADADNIKRTVWQMWYIDLASLGMSLSNVTELSIGFERSGFTGGSGNVYFDDIRLYPYSYERQLITPAEPNTAGLVGHWMFDKGSGTVAVDSSAKGNDGTLNGGPQWVAGQIGGALNFNSTDDYVDISSSSSLESMTDVTLSAWIKAETLQPVQECTIVRRDACGLPGVRTIYLMDLFTDGHLRLFFWGKDSADMTIGTSTTDLRDGNWHHVAVVRDNGNTKAYGYVDGIVAIDVTDIADGSFESADTSVYIGQYDRDNSNSQFKGTIDEVCIYDRALSPAEIAWLGGMSNPFDKPF